MSKKLDLKKNKTTELHLSAEESQELGMILDRLSVQNPEGTSLDNYLQSLVKILGGREILVAALLEQLGKKPSKVGFQTYLALKDTVRDKKLTKIMKQTSYRFSQRGFVGEGQVRPGESIVLVQKEGRKPVAHVMPVKGTFWLFAALIPEAGYPAPTLVTALMEQALEGVYIKVTEGSQKNYRDYLRKASEHDPDRKPFEVPVYHVARLFFELLAFSKKKETSPEQEQATKLLSPFHDPEKPPCAYDLMPPLDAPGEHLPEMNEVELLKAIDWSWLVFPKEEITPYWQKLQDLENPVLVIPKEIQEERTTDLMKRAADELCIGETRWLYQRFFEEQALWLKKSSRDDLAWSAWVAAQHLASSAPASANPAVTQMVSLSMRQYWPKDFEQSKPQAEPFHRTESGLIVPS
jgi:hypothetical protein